MSIFSIYSMHEIKIEIIYAAALQRCIEEFIPLLIVFEIVKGMLVCQEKAVPWELLKSLSQRFFAGAPP